MCLQVDTTRSYSNLPCCFVICNVVISCGLFPFAVVVPRLEVINETSWPTFISDDVWCFEISFSVAENILRHSTGNRGDRTCWMSINGQSSAGLLRSNGAGNFPTTPALWRLFPQQLFHAEECIELWYDELLQMWGFAARVQTGGALGGNLPGKSGEIKWVNQSINQAIVSSTEKKSVNQSINRSIDQQN